MHIIFRSIRMFHKVIILLEHIDLFKDIKIYQVKILGHAALVLLC